jgi:hypothetical protein
MNKTRKLYLPLLLGNNGGCASKFHDTQAA